jgi:hypothetical protein
MPVRKLKKPKDGEKLPETPDMVAWRKEFDTLDLDAHKAKLKALGLDEEELAEFEEMEKDDVPLEEELIHEGTSEEIKDVKVSSKQVKKKAVKKKPIKKATKKQ